MKKYLFILAAVILGTSFVSAQNLKIGYVDSQVILNQLPAAIKAQGDLDALTNKWSAQLDSMTSDYQKELADYQSKAATMKDVQKKQTEQRLVTEQQKLVKFRQDKFAQGSGEIYKKQDEIFTPVKNKIYKAIAEIAKEEGMQFVFDKSGDIILLYADSKYDITYKVLDKLKRGSDK